MNRIRRTIEDEKRLSSITKLNSSIVDALDVDDSNIMVIENGLNDDEEAENSDDSRD